MLTAVLVLVLQAPGVTLGDHGGRELGSFSTCDRPVIPPRCTSVGNNLRHYVTFDASLVDPLRDALRHAMGEVYDPTRLVMIEQAEVSSLTDVIVFSADYGENGAAGWVNCPPGATRGVSPLGHRWCLGQELHLNLNPRYSIFFEDDGSRRHVACHELGHTLGLRHWGNPPVTDPPTGETCMTANTPDGFQGIHPTDSDHIDGYPSYVTHPDRRIELARVPAADAVAALGTGGVVGADQVEVAGTLAELIASADAVVSGRVVAVDAGRSFGSDTYRLHYATVTVAADEVLAGGIGNSDRVLLEVPLFSGPGQLEALRDEMRGSQRLLFLRNKGVSARQAGLPDSGQATESIYHRLVSFGSEVIERNGMALVPLDDGAALNGLGGRPFDAVLRLVRDAGR